MLIYSVSGHVIFRVDPLASKTISVISELMLNLILYSSSIYSTEKRYNFNVTSLLFILFCTQCCTREHPEGFDHDIPTNTHDETQVLFQKCKIIHDVNYS